MKQKWICQTFWTRPMSNISVDAKIAKLSLFYAHRGGYKVRMYTDAVGYSYLRDFGYDDIVLDLDLIPESIPICLFAASKAVALEKEPVGVIHIDYDVFIKGNCLDDFYNDPTWDIILQHIEGKDRAIIDGCYTYVKNILKQIATPSWFPIDHIDATNVGVIGFNNESAKREYLDLYYKCVNYYKSFLTHSSDTGVPDLLFEQTNINWIVQNSNYKTKYLLPAYPYGDRRLHQAAKAIGFQHMVGSWKRQDTGKSYIEQALQKISLDRQYNTKVIFAFPTCGKTWLSDHDDRFVDFDKYMTHFGFEYYDVENICRLYSSLKKKFENTDKIILTSDPILLRTYLKDFSAIYVLPLDMIEERINSRNAEKPESERKQWILDIKSQISQVSPLNIITIEDYLSDHINEMIEICQK